MSIATQQPVGPRYDEPRNVRRMNRLGGGLGLAIFAMIVGGIIYGVYTTNQKRNAGERERNVSAADIAGAYNRDGLLADFPENKPIIIREPAPPAPEPPPLAKPERPKEPPRDPWAEQIAAQRIAALGQALTAPAAIDGWDAKEVTGEPAAGQPGQGGLGGPASRPSAASLAGLTPDGAMSGTFPGMGAAFGGGENPYEYAIQNNQGGKDAWLASAGDIGSEYLDYTRRPTVSPFELKIGTLIPAVMVGGLHSDLPGFISAQVTSNVYDTATGRHLLIPQGSKLVGRYDSEISFGAERVLVAFNRVIFPDGSSLNLDGAPGVDVAGLAGLKDQVNHHIMRLIGYGILASVFSAAYDITQDDDDDDGTGATVGSAVGQQLALTGAQIARRNLNVQPTIEIRNGMRLNIILHADVVLPSPYQGE